MAIATAPSRSRYAPANAGINVIYAGIPLTPAAIAAAAQNEKEVVARRQDAGLDGIGVARALTAAG